MNTLTHLFTDQGQLFAEAGGGDCGGGGSLPGGLHGSCSGLY